MFLALGALLPIDPAFDNMDQACCIIVLGKKLALSLWYLFKKIIKE